MRAAPSFRYLRDPVFLVGAAVYLIARFILKPLWGHEFPFIANQLGDMLLIPVALPVLLFLQHVSGLRPGRLPPRHYEISLWIVLWSALFEWLGPVVLHLGVVDFRDAVAYLVGGVMAALLWRAIYRPVEL